MESEMGRAEENALRHHLFCNNSFNLIVQNILVASFYQFRLLQEFLQRNER